MVKRLADIDEVPIVGRFYKVPTVFGDWNGWRRYWPVMTPLHNDAEIIDFDRDHYHIDPRFVPDRIWQSVNRSGWRQNADIQFTGEPLQCGPHSHNPEGLPAAVERIIKCRRAMAYRDIFFIGTPATWPFRLETAYADQRLKAGLVCPHRGTCLKSMPVVNGVVQCPAHGLHWNVETGALVKWVDRSVYDVVAARRFLEGI